MINDRLRAMALKYADAVAIGEAPCVYGHLHCAAAPGGVCLDELFSSLGLDNDGNPIEEGG